MNVSATPMPVARANSRSAAAAPARATPLPASTIGFDRRADELEPPRSSSGAAAPAGCGSCARAGSGSASSVLRHDVLGQLDVGRAGLLRLGDLERLAHDLGDRSRARSAARSTS